MSRYKIALTLFLLGFPLACLFYKIYYLGIQLVPEKASNYWQVELNASGKRSSDINREMPSALIIPVPTGSSHQEIENLTVNGNPLDPDEELLEDRDYLVVDPASVGLTPTNLSFQVQILKPQPDKKPEKIRLGREEKARYLDLSSYSEQEREYLKKLKETLTFPTDSRQDQLNKFFYYLADEISLKHESHKISDVVDLSSGSFLVQARTLVGLARMARIPARVVFGAKFLEPKPSNPIRYTRVFMTEVFIKGQWQPYLPEGRIEGELDANHLVFCNTCGDQAKLLENENFLSLLIKPVKYDPISSEEQLSYLETISPLWGWLSLHRLPISVQGIILGIILIPFGTIAISFARVLLGVETFGIFMPLLLTLFFIETSFLFGFMFFAIVVLLGLTQRFFLDRFYLLAVPRISILLSFTIIVYLLFAVICMRLNILTDTQRSLGYFPIVIITIFIEKLSLSFIEEGPVNTFKTAVGTFLVSVMCYGLLAFSWLKMFLFNNPEMIFFSIGMNVLIGSYTGFRLLELLRFKEVDGAHAIDFK